MQPAQRCILCAAKRQCASCGQGTSHKSPENQRLRTEFEGVLSRISQRIMGTRPDASNSRDNRAMPAVNGIAAKAQTLSDERYVEEALQAIEDESNSSKSKRNKKHGGKRRRKQQKQQLGEQHGQAEHDRHEIEYEHHNHKRAHETHRESNSEPIADRDWSAEGHSRHCRAERYAETQNFAERHGFPGKTTGEYQAILDPRG